MHTLQKQNQLQDEQIKCLAKFLNLTMHQVSKCSEMLYEMDTKIFVINKTLHHIMWNIDAIRYEAIMLHHFPNKNTQSTDISICSQRRYQIIIRIYENFGFLKN